MRKIIFLDIDGVLAGHDFLCQQKGFIDPEKVSLLNQLNDAEIVISSSWGYDNGNTEKQLKACGLKIPIIGYTKHYHKDWICRGNEIEEWICDNLEYDGHEYVIFDDDSDMLLSQKDNFIQTNGSDALTQEAINKARKILNREV